MKKIATFLKIENYRPAFAVLVLCCLPFALFGQTTHQVEVKNNVYIPAELTINTGDEVVWTNTQGDHNVNATESAFPDNPEYFGNGVSSGWTFSHTFTIPGTYNYQCDPHTRFGMYGVINVVEAQTYKLDINFTGMTPHVGQKFFIKVEDRETSEEIARKQLVVEESFSLEIPGLTDGHSYRVEFFSDHNNNGYYDAPPADHAWRIELDDISGDQLINFSHNTDFKDISWDHRVFVNFSSMTPHVGQELYIALINVTDGFEVDRESHTITENFSLDLGDLEPGKDYRLDFFADYNDNDRYDLPSADHSWQIMIESATGDEVIDFAHNTNFTGLDWKYKLRINMEGMNPHVGQMLTLYVRDAITGDYLDTLKLEAIPGPEFSLETFVVAPGNSYFIDFFSDHNGNMAYDAPPADHAWRLNLTEVKVDTQVDFIHNTNFTDIMNITSIKQSGSLNNYTLYPNPTSDYLNIDLRTLSSTGIIRIYDLSGSIVKNIHSNGGNIVRLNVSGFRSGIYTIEVVSDHFTSRNIFIKK